MLRIKTNRLKILTIWLIVLWYACLKIFMPMLLVNLVSLLLYFVGVLYFFNKIIKEGISKFDYAIFLITIIYPIVSAIQSNIIFNQPVLVGIASFRGILVIFLYYYFRSCIKPNELIDIIIKYQYWIMLLSFILLYCFHIDNAVLSNLKPDVEGYSLTGTVEGTNELRGLRLTIGSMFTMLCLSVWTSRLYILNKGKKVAVINILLIIIYLLFVHKGRSALAVSVIMLILPLLYHLSIKNLLKVITCAILVFVILMVIPSIRDRFLVVYDLFGNTQTQGTGDFSGVARLEEILLAIDLIKDHPFLGVGNLSYHYNNGFIGYFNEHFYVGDIGIFGLLLVGGVFVFILYIFLFKTALAHAKYYNFGSVKYLIVKNLCVYYIITPFFGGNAIWDEPSILPFVFLLTEPSRLIYNKNENILS